MKFHINPHHHVKIWLSGNPDVFLNPENQLRLVKMRADNPNDRIHFVYDSRLLSPNALQTLHAFCDKYQIIALDAKTEVSDQLKTDEERRLFQWYLTEITSLGEGGNLASASDILRVLSPVYEKGIYSDFDVVVKTAHLPPEIEIEAPLLLRVGSIKMFYGMEQIVVNNEVLALASEEDAAAKAIKKVHQAILKRYQPNFPFHTDVCEQIKKDLQRHMPESIAEGVYQFIESQQRKLMPIPHQMEQMRLHSPVRFRRNLLAEKKQPFEALCREFLKGKKIDVSGLATEEALYHKAATELRQELKQILSSWIFWLTTPSWLYQKMKQKAAVSDDKSLIQSYFQTLFEGHFKTSVTHTSGPMAFGAALFDAYILNQAELKKVKLSAFSHYGLDQAFLSDNHLPFHTKATELQRLMQGDPGEFNDLSWLERGQEYIAKREDKMNQAAATVTRFFRHTKAMRPTTEAQVQRLVDKLNKHIVRLQKAYQNPFAFYGYVHGKQELDLVVKLRALINHKYHIDTQGIVLLLKTFKESKAKTWLWHKETQPLLYMAQRLCYLKQVSEPPRPQLLSVHA